MNMLQPHNINSWRPENNPTMSRNVIFNPGLSLPLI